MSTRTTEKSKSLGMVFQAWYLTAVPNAGRVHMVFNSCTKRWQSTPMFLCFEGEGTLAQAAHFSACWEMRRCTVLDYNLGVRNHCRFSGKSTLISKSKG